LIVNHGKNKSTFLKFSENLDNIDS
jgi:hypothetical protein